MYKWANDANNDASEIEFELINSGDCGEYNGMSSVEIHEARQFFQ